MRDDLRNIEDVCDGADDEMDQLRVKLKPCPFCGDLAALENTITEMKISCCNLSCRASMKVAKVNDPDDCYFEQKVTNRWNRRMKIGEKK